MMFDKLGSTPDAVAQSLRSGGIRGVRNTVRTLNPIVRWATAQTPGMIADLILVNRLRIGFVVGELTEIALPEPVLQFLAEFHKGRYPDLELPHDPAA